MDSSAFAEVWNRPGVKEQIALCSFYASGIIVSLVIYGYLQEHIMTMSYAGELFEFSVFLVFMNRACAVLYSTMMVFMKGEAMLWQAPLWKYLVVSLSNVYASTCQYEALKYVSFPVQQLGKSFKMCPIMLWGIAISGKVYSITDWLVAFAVTGGVTEFLLTGPLSSPDGGSSVIGLLLLLCFLFLDGLTSTMQEKVFKQHAVSKYNQMMWVNICSAIVSFVTLVFTGTLVPALVFCRHGAFFFHAMLLSVCSVTGQVFIYSQIKEFGALVFGATMNVRQMISIIVSYVQYNHAITGLQILGLLVVFGALFYKSYAGLRDSPAKQEKQPLVEERDSKA